MVRQDELGLLTLTGIAHRCAQETELFFQHRQYDPRYCFELFRRAIAQCSHAAWELVYRQYRPLVAGWVARHIAFPVSGERVGYFVNRAFEKMWSALTPDKFDLFPNLRSVLRYLQMCVHSVIVDHMRLREHETLRLDEQLPAAPNPAAGSTVEGTALARLRREDLWNYLNQRLKSEQERCVLYGTFVLALKPRDLYVQYKSAFRDVQEVYRVKENVIARLRRDSELKQFLDDT
jgi:DNA-directed RNA polymerase specialized sigma24 family protein